MASQQRIEDLKKGGWSVHLSEWTATGGVPGRSWFVRGPGFQRMPDDYGSEADAWDAASEEEAGAQIALLRATLQSLQRATCNTRTNAAVKAHAEAWRVLRITTPQGLKDAALALARKRNPAITTFDEAVEAYGMSLVAEAAGD